MGRDGQADNGPKEDRHCSKTAASASRAAAWEAQYSPYTHTRTMWNTGGMRGSEKKEGQKRRLAGAAGVRVERDRVWALDRFCGLV